jgi:CheY-like chemotaxis protein
MIVVVDDDNDVREAICEILHGEGYATTAATNGQEAIEWLRSSSERPELIILDLMMPVMDGWTFLSGIESDPRLKNIPVAMMSAHPSIRTELMRARNANDPIRLLLPKPLHVLRLLSTVRTLCAPLPARDASAEGGGKLTTPGSS